MSWAVSLISGSVRTSIVSAGLLRSSLRARPLSGWKTYV
jgi:hypothetical protein